MKIVIPANGECIESGVCQSFGRAPYFMVYNVETKQVIYLENIAANSQGGAGIKAAQSIVDNNVNILITPRCGENAAKVLKAAGIQIFKTINDSIGDNIEAYTNDELQLLEEIHAGFHNHGGK